MRCLRWHYEKSTGAMTFPFPFWTTVQPKQPSRLTLTTCASKFFELSIVSKLSTHHLRNFQLPLTFQTAFPVDVILAKNLPYYSSVPHTLTYEEYKRRHIRREGRFILYNSAGLRNETVTTITWSHPAHLDIPFNVVPFIDARLKLISNDFWITESSFPPNRMVRCFHETAGVDKEDFHFLCARVGTPTMSMHEPHRARYVHDDPRIWTVLARVNCRSAIDLAARRAFAFISGLVAGSVAWSTAGKIRLSSNRQEVIALGGVYTTRRHPFDGRPCRPFSECACHRRNHVETGQMTLVSFVRESHRHAHLVFRGKTDDSWFAEPMVNVGIHQSVLYAILAGPRSFAVLPRSC